MERWARRIAGVMVGALVLTAASLTSFSQEITYFRIGTGATSGTYFPIGGIVANVISSPPGSLECGKGGSCGVPGLVAVAQSTSGSVANLDLLRAGNLESAIVQADIAHRAYKGLAPFSRKGRMTKLRAIANLFPEAVHLVVRADSGLTSIRGLGMKRVSLGEPGSGTQVLARQILISYGLADPTFDPVFIAPVYMKPGQAGDALRRNTLDAFFLVAGYPVTAISTLAKDTGIRLLPLEGREAANVRRTSSFLRAIEIPAGTYAGNEAPIPTIGVWAEWVVTTDLSEDLVYKLTAALWHQNSRPLFMAGHPLAREIRLERAVEDLAVPLHPGAVRFYREKGLFNDNGKDESAARKAP